MRTAEDPGLRRRNYHFLTHQLAKQFRAWRDGYDDKGPCGPMRDRRESVPNSTETTPRMGDMDDEQIDFWARRISAADAEQAINMSNEAERRAKIRAGEGA